MPRFVYTAHAVGLAGRIRIPFGDVIDAQASCALAGTGGFTSGKVEKFNYRDIITFDSATSFATGNFTGTGEAKGFETSVTTTIEGLNILGIVTAGRIVARLTSLHFSDANGKPVLDKEPLIRATGSHFEDLSIAGKPLTLEADLGLMVENCTYSAASKGLPTHNALQASVSTGCIFKDRHEITIPGFGKIFLGEFILTPFSRRVTMLRVELGSPYEGDVLAGDVVGNGNPIPP